MKTQSITIHDRMPNSVHGHWLAEAYYGEVKRAALSKLQREENLHEEWKANLELRPMEFRHLGAVLNRRYGTVVDANNLLVSEQQFKDGVIVDGPNLVVTVGKQMIMDRLYGLSAVGAMTRTGVGTSATAAAVGNTTLTGSAFKVFDATPTRSGVVVTSITTFGTADANLNWQELALDNTTTMLNRIAPIGPFNKTSAVSIVVTVTLTQA